METSSGESLWPWIIGGIALIVAIVGVVLAISANDSSTNDKKAINAAAGEIEEQLSGVAGAQAAGEAKSDQAERLARQDRKRIKRTVNRAVAGGEKQLDAVQGEVRRLQTESTELKKGEASLRGEVSNLSAETEDLEAEVAKLKQRVNNRG
jgi:FtsZ-binding cell division protein ZapB